MGDCTQIVILMAMENTRPSLESVGVTPILDTKIYIQCCFRPQPRASVASVAGGQFPLPCYISLVLTIRSLYVTPLVHILLGYWATVRIERWTDPQMPIADINLTMGSISAMDVRSHRDSGGRARSTNFLCGTR